MTPKGHKYFTIVIQEAGITLNNQYRDYICRQLMGDKKEIVSVASKHIESGIKKYKGESDAHLNALLRNAGLNYTSYVFNDGRILLVMPNNLGAFLYADEEALFAAIDLGK